MRSIRVGNGCGFWGDNLDAPILLARDGKLDYLTLEYLAELTMSILAGQKARDPQAGFAADFLDVLSRLPEEHYPRIITNAGGMNPGACAIKAKNLRPKAKIAVVDGDDLMPRLDELLAAGHGLINLDTGAKLETIRSQVVSANAYLGAGAIVEALRLGADIVITGRVADASLTVAPFIHEFDVAWDDWHRLSSATVAGHLIECGAQATGGLWCNYPEAPNLADVGYPIAVLNEDGSMIVTKPERSGGSVNVETIGEQLLYEVADPARYLTPDVVADFTSVTLSQSGSDRVHVTAAKGLLATNTYKASIAYRKGYASSGMLVLAGPDAVRKARLAGEMLLARLDRIGARPRDCLVETIGAGACAPGVLPIAEPSEVVLRVAVQDDRKTIVERFTKEFAPLVTSGPPGVTGYTTGRPPVREVYAYWPTLIDKRAVHGNARLI